MDVVAEGIETPRSCVRRRGGLRVRAGLPLRAADAGRRDDRRGYIVSGAETPSSPSERASTRRVATDVASLNDFSASLGLEHRAVAVVGGEGLRELERVDGDEVRRAARRPPRRPRAGKREQLLDQLALGRLQRQPAARGGQRRGDPLLPRLAQDLRDPRVRVLDVVDRVLGDCSFASARSRSTVESAERESMKKRVASTPISSISSSSVTKSPRRLDIEARSPPSTTCTNWSSGTTSRSGSAPAAAMIALSRTT